MSPLAIHIALGLALAESAGLAALLLARARGVAGGRLLVLFLAGVAIWIAGNELPGWLGRAAIRPATCLIAFASLTSAVFLHFAIRFCDARVPPLGIVAAYGLGVGTTLVAIALPAGEYRPWEGLRYVFRPNALGWAVGLIWAAFGVLGHLVMLTTWIRQRGLQRRQIAAVFAASAIGLVSMTGYAFAALGLDVYPYPLLMLPAYPLVMVYGILRYQVMVVNEWARRAVAFTLLAAIGTLVIALLASMPFPLRGAESGWPAWLSVIAGLVVSLSLVDPFRRLALRIVYPGSEIDPKAVEFWRSAFARASDLPQLFREASAALSAQLRMPVAVVDGRDSRARPGGPSLVCTKSEETWHVVPDGWEAAPPGPRAVATLFATVLSEALRQLDLTIASAALERERQLQARLAELGTLAAIVAHDIRNPLNIIAMAATAAPAETRKEIGIQVQRVSQLAQDLLDYAKSWQIDRQRFDLAEAIRAMAAQHHEIALGGSISHGLTINGDPRRIRQVLANLIDNARAARANDSDSGHIAIDGERTADGWLRVHICDDGPGIPPDIRESLFQPFVSRRPEGTGLGLAIVARIMEAHGGRVALTDRPGWSTCFTLSFPLPESA